MLTHALWPWVIMSGETVKRHFRVLFESLYGVAVLLKKPN